MGTAPHPVKLAAALDRGAGRDKVSSGDPAAAPLGTDEEAAGTPISPDAVQIALAHEVRGKPRPVREGHEPYFPVRAMAVVFLILLALAAAAAAYLDT